MTRKWQRSNSTGPREFREWLMRFSFSDVFRCFALPCQIVQMAKHNFWRAKTNKKIVAKYRNNIKSVWIVLMDFSFYGIFFSNLLKERWSRLGLFAPWEWEKWSNGAGCSWQPILRHCGIVYESFLVSLELIYAKALSEAEKLRKFKKFWL